MNCYELRIYLNKYLFINEMEMNNTVVMYFRKWNCYELKICLNKYLLINEMEMNNKVVIFLCILI